MVSKQRWTDDDVDADGVAAASARLTTGHLHARRATVGTLFEHQEICRTSDLEGLVRQADAMVGCRSFDDVVRAIRAMRTLE